MTADERQDYGYGYGIIASESGFKVEGQCTGNIYPCDNYDKNSFTGLGYGIFASNVLKNKPYTLTQSEFTGCFIGLYNTGTSNGTILFNNFNLGSVPNTDVSADQMGVFFENGVSGFILQNNHFKGMGGNVDRTVGMLCKNLGQFNNVINHNIYTGLTYGNVAQGNNATSSFIDRGLYYLCNRNTAVSRSDFAVVNGFGGGKIRNSQGLEDTNEDGDIFYRATSNRFSYTAIDFNNQGEEIKYYYYPDGASETPVTINGNIILIVAEENTCEEMSCKPPCKHLADMPLLMSILKEKSPLPLEEKDLVELEALTTVDESLTGNIARNILRMHGYHFPPLYRLPEQQGKSKNISINTINEVKEETLVYPNPNKGVFNFLWSPVNKTNQNARLQIRNLSGRLISEQTIIPFERNKIDLQQHQHGVYFYQLLIEGQAPKVGKLILQ